MTRLFWLETKLWFRSGQLIALLVVCIGMSVTTVLATANSSDLLSALGQEDLSQTIPPASDSSIQDSVFKNLIQIALLFCGVAMARSVSTKNSPALGIYYSTSAVRPIRVFGPKILVGAVVVCLAVTSGLVVGWYYAFLNFDSATHISLKTATAMTFVFVVEVFCWMLLIAGAAIWSGYQIVSAIILHFILFVGAICSGIGADITAFPFSMLLDPAQYSGGEWKFSLGFSISIGLVSLIASSARPLKL